MEKEKESETDKKKSHGDVNMYTDALQLGSTY